jgi:hypothetical protein
MNPTRYQDSGELQKSLDLGSDMQIENYIYIQNNLFFCFEIFDF